MSKRIKKPVVLKTTIITSENGNCEIEVRRNGKKLDFNNVQLENHQYMVNSITAYLSLIQKSIEISNKILNDAYDKKYKKNELTTD